MRFGAVRPRDRRESIVPMINVVFLLLVFLLLTAELGPEAPFEVTPPAAGAPPAAAGEAVLFVASDGRLSALGRTGEDALAGIGPGMRVTIRADAALPAAELAALLPRLAGAAEIRLATVPR